MGEKYSRLLVPVIFAVLIAVTLLPNGLNLPGRDSGGYLFIGQRVLTGDVLYRDVWGHKPPVIFFLNALGLLIGVGSRWGVWLIEFTAVYAAALFGYRLLKKAFGNFAALYGSFVWLICFISIIESGNFTEEYALVCQFISLYLFLQAEKEGNYHWRGFLIGVLAALSFFLRQNLIGLSFSITVYIFFSRLINRRFLRLAKELGLIILGALSISLLIVSYFVVNSSLNYLWEAAFLFNFQYVQSSAIKRIMSLSAGIKYILWSPLLLATWVLAIVYSFFQQKTTAKVSPVLTLAVIGLPIEIILSSISGRLYRHYFIPWLPYIAVLMSFFAHFLINLANGGGVSAEKSPHPDKRYSVVNVKILMISLLVFLSFSPIVELVVGYYRAFNISSRDIHNQAVEYVRSKTDPDDYLLVWGAETSLNFLSERRSPSRFFYQHAIVGKGYLRKEMLAEFVQDVLTNKPEVIIDVGSDYFPPIVNVISSAHEYRLDRTFGRWKVYIKNS